MAREKDPKTEIEIEPSPDPEEKTAMLPSGGGAPEPVEGTRVDLGEDLFAQIKAEAAAQPARSAEPSTSGSASVPGLPGMDSSLLTLLGQNKPTLQESLLDQLHSARILISEGLLEEAKRILHSVLIHDSGNAEGKQLLQEIHETELKQIFNEDRARRRVLSRSEPEPELSGADSNDVLSRLDRDLALGMLEEGEDSPKLELSVLTESGGMMEFQSLMEQGIQGISHRDRVDLGIAFLEMGLYEIAIRQFKAVADGDLGAVCLLALAQIRGGMPFEATLSLQPVINDPDIPPAEKKEIYYLLGCAYERMGKADRAKECFLFVQKIHPGYRDVLDRIGK